MLKFATDRSGYFYVGLTLGDGTRPKSIKVHRLVAVAFVPKDESNNVVNHIDGNKTNNAASNLEWTTVKGNVMHAVATGLINPERKLTKSEERAIVRDLAKGMSRQDAATKYGVSSSLASIYAVRAGIPVTHANASRNADMAADLKAGVMRRCDIAAKYGVSRGYVSTVARKLGLEKKVNQHG